MYTHDPYTVPGSMPRTSGAHQRTVPVCLDYVKGLCGSKRLTCKFAHPMLPKEGGHVKICEVYVTTGFCKFGVACHDYHPSTTAYTPVCLPPSTRKMTTEARDVADLISLPVQQQEDTTQLHKEPVQLLERLASPVPGVTAATVSEAAREVTDIFRAAELDDRSTVLRCLLAHAVAATPDLVVAEVIGAVYRNLHNDEQAVFRQQVTEQCEKLLYHTEDTMLLAGGDADTTARLNRNRHGNVALMGRLYIGDVVTLSSINQAFDFMLLRAMRVDREGAFHALLLATLLSVAGDHLQLTQPVQLSTRTQRLHTCVQRHGDNVSAIVVQQTKRFITESCCDTQSVL